MHVAFDHLCCPENFPANWIAENVAVQPLPQSRAFWKFKDTTIVNDAGAHVTALQGNDPDPPASPKKMIRSPLACREAIFRIIGKTLSPFVAVPLLDAAESRPYRIDGVFRVRAKISKLSSEHGSASRSIDQPACTNAGFAEFAGDADPLSVPIIQLQAYYFCWTPQVATRLHCQIKHV